MTRFLRALLRFGLELIGLAVDDAREEKRESKAEARSAQREQEMLRRFDRNPLCKCGHALSEHAHDLRGLPIGHCRRCDCVDPYLPDS